MSLNSLQDDMSRRAASMAAMAKRTNNPQDIQALQQRLVAEIQNGTIKPYVGIPLVQELTTKLTEAKAKMAQAVAGAGMQQPQGGAPIAQQVMAQAAPPAPTPGVEGLPSNLPQSYAGGGIIAFEGGGHVEPMRFQNAGVVPSFGNVPAYTAANPNASFVDFLRKMQIPTSEYARLGPAEQKNIMDMFRSTAAAAETAAPAAAEAAGPAAQAASKGLLGRALGVLTNPYAMVGTTGLDLTRAAAGQVRGSTPEQREQMIGYGADPSGTSFAAAIMNAANPAADTPVRPTAPPTAADLGPVPGSTGRDVMGGQAFGAAPAAAPAAAPGGGGLGGFKTPTLGGMAKVAPPKLTSLNDITKDLSKDKQEIAEKAVKETQATLESYDKPGFEARQARLEAREAGQEKDSAMGRALNLMSLGFGIAGSKERSLAGALGNEGRQGIADLIKGEAAARAAKDRLEDFRDNLEQQKVAAKKGNYQAAQAAADRATADFQASKQMALTSAHYGNTEGLQLFQTQQQGEFQRASLDQSGKLGLAGLGLQAQQLAQTGAYQQGMLGAQEKRFAAMDKASQARMSQVQAKALGDFNTTVAPQLNAQLTKEYGANWRTGSDARSLQAQMLFKQQQKSYLMDALGQHADTMAAKDSSEY